MVSRLATLNASKAGPTSGGAIGLLTDGELVWGLCLPTHVHAITAVTLHAVHIDPPPIHTLCVSLGLCFDHMGEVWSQICLTISYS